MISVGFYTGGNLGSEERFIWLVESLMLKVLTGFTKNYLCSHRARESEGIEKEEWRPHLSPTVVSTAWISSSHFPSAPPHNEACFCVELGLK